MESLPSLLKRASNFSIRSFAICANAFATPVEIAFPASRLITVSLTPRVSSESFSFSISRVSCDRPWIFQHSSAERIKHLSARWSRYMAPPECLGDSPEALIVQATDSMLHTGKHAPLMYINPTLGGPCSVTIVCWVGWCGCGLIG